MGKRVLTISVEIHPPAPTVRNFKVKAVAKVTLIAGVNRIVIDGFQVVWDYQPYDLGGHRCYRILPPPKLASVVELDQE